MPKKPNGRPRGGPKRDFVKAHLHLSNKDILALAIAAKIGFTELKHVSAHRTILKKQGIAARYPGARPPKKRPSAKAIVAQATIEPPQMHPKEVDLRRLLFELGFDKFQALFREAEEVHKAMTRR